MNNTDIRAFRDLVYGRAAECWRDLPWRRTAEPYAIMVSEMMLQQTQVPRVVPKFIAWLDGSRPPRASRKPPPMRCSDFGAASATTAGPSPCTARANC